jgi:hypothetical protein
MARAEQADSVRRTNLERGHHFREILWHTFGRMILLYFMPLLLLAVFFPRPVPAPNA